jgi:hypothetical protein
LSRAPMAHVSNSNYTQEAVIRSMEV